MHFICTTPAFEESSQHHPLFPSKLPITDDPPKKWQPYLNSRYPTRVKKLSEVACLLLAPPLIFENVRRGNQKLTPRHSERDPDPVGLMERFNRYSTWTLNCLKTKACHVSHRCEDTTFHSAGYSYCCHQQWPTEDLAGPTQVLITGLIPLSTWVVKWNIIIINYDLSSQSLYRTRWSVDSRV